MTLDNFHVQISGRVLCNLALLNSYKVLLNSMRGNGNLQSIHRNPRKPSLSQHGSTASISAASRGYMLQYFLVPPFIHLGGKGQRSVAFLVSRKKFNDWAKFSLLTLKSEA